MNIKTYLSSLLAVLIIFIIGFFLYQKYSVITVEYTGLNNENGEALEVKKDVVVKEESLDTDKIEFTQRKITGGGVNPGFVISVLETQPNVFTGRVIIDDGVYQYPVTLKEEVTDIYVGEMKSKDKKVEIFSMRKENKNCLDEDQNLYEYTLSGTYGSTQFYGCGGKVLKITALAE